MATLVYDSKVYVGTYRKYNNGSIAGAWISLAGCKDYDDFLAQCRKVHKDERDPEFMIQDTECMPDGLTCMESLDRDEFNDIKKAMYEQEEPQSAGVQIIENYSPKSFQVVGDTYPIRKDLERLGGAWNRKMRCWFFSNKKLDAVKAFLAGAEISTSSASPAVSGDKFTQWLDEFASKQKNSDYYKKEFVGAIKIRDHYILLDKPSIETKFCFHDEGPQYDFYCKLKESEENMKQYFLSENRKAFTGHIDFINENGHIYVNLKDSAVEACLCHSNYIWGREVAERATDEETALILEGLKFALAKFDVRLNAYVKRYGISKLHTWTYWADA